MAEAETFAPKVSEDERVSRLSNDASMVFYLREIRRLLAEPEKRPGATAILGTLAPSLGLAYALRRRLLP